MGTVAKSPGRCGVGSVRQPIIVWHKVLYPSSGPFSVPYKFVANPFTLIDLSACTSSVHDPSPAPPWFSMPLIQKLRLPQAQDFVSSGSYISWRQEDTRKTQKVSHLALKISKFILTPIFSYTMMRFLLYCTLQLRINEVACMWPN